LPLENEIVPEKFLPSSRSVAFCKTTWEAVGGYPEWLDYSEDLVFDLRLKAKYGDFVFVPTASVYFKPRKSLRSFFRQYYLYARGDGKADLWRKRHVARYITYLLLIPMLAILGFAIHPGFWLLYLPGTVIYLWQPYRRLPYLWQSLTPAQKIIACTLIPVIRVVGDIAKMIGYQAGWRWRLRYHPPDWKLLL
ncbi:MAG TPA: hypothetical protein VJZ27_19065, partial [Aggregatilineales bacterium]|nr:hypothetical protein [Aggregatilineales bacterium]